LQEKMKAKVLLQFYSLVVILYNAYNNVNIDYT